MKLSDFLAQFVEGYLFGDLKSMAKIKLAASQQFGAAGYPMIQSALAGVELLGYLLMPNEDDFNDRMGATYFSNYWDNYLAKEDSAYAGLAKIIYNLFRHGIAHSFVTKHGAYVTRGGSMGIAVDAANRQIAIDADQFKQALIISYKNNVTPIVDGTAKGNLTNAARMQQKLDSLIAKYDAKSQKLFDELVASVPFRPSIALALPIGASGPASAIISASLSFSSGFRTSSGTPPNSSGIVNPTGASGPPPAPL
jgi:hypothetical protein